MAAEIEFCVLGSLVVRHGGVEVPLSSRKQRAVLAALLLNAGRLVSLDELAEVLWGSSPPPSARVTIQNYVMRLRKALGDTAGSRISTQPRGYLIQVDPSELDVSRFDAHLVAARAAGRNSDWGAAAAQARAGLALWRGDPLVDVESESLVVRKVPQLEELRLQMLQTRIDADLHLGRHAEVITELRQLTEAHPLREHLHGLLMLALYRDGRQAEALAVYRRARQILVDELGTEPGSGLQTLHQQMLNADQILDAAAPGTPGANGTNRTNETNGTNPANGTNTAHGATVAVPRELPTGVRTFTGRSAEVGKLTRLLDDFDEGVAGTLVISAIGGAAGVGKTALAVHWAHRIADRFPDGQLYVNLRGYDPADPMPAADALARFLRSLGVPGQDIPAEEDERAARYRSILAGKRMLLVLDNAGSVEQVRPLLPGSPTCVVVVTSRDAMTGLVARDGATRLDLDLLPLDDAIILLRSLIGVRVEVDPDAATQLAVQCCRLPLALRVAAELAVSRPATPLAALVAELGDLQKRLSLLDAGGDQHTAVRTVFSWSYRQLDAATARTFRLLGLHPGLDFEPYAAAALSGTTLAQAGQALEKLTQAHLIQPATPDRYSMHDLLRAYARDLAATQDGDQEQRAALTRLFDYYLNAAATAKHILVAIGRQARVPAPASPAPPLTDSVTARAWLDSERATLVAVAVHAAQDGWPGHVTRLSTTLLQYLDTNDYYHEGITIHGLACRAAHQIGDRAAEATALIGLGRIDLQQGRHQQALSRFEEARDLYRSVSDRVGQADAANNLGSVDSWLGRWHQAGRHYREALGLYHEVGDRLLQARVLGNLGVIDRRLGRYQQAADRQQKALAIFREFGDLAGQVAPLIRLGTVALQTGRYPQAAEYLEQAATLCRDIGDRNGQATALGRLGDVALRVSRYQQALEYQEQSWILFRELGDPGGEAVALNGLGEALLAIGQPGQAGTRHAAALDLASRSGHPPEEARAHDGLGHAYHAAGDDEQAREHWRQAIAIYTELSLPEAEQVRTQLALTDEDRYLEPETAGG
ncbi:MAG: tetratricopeptide repeat protein [Streptosporangiaceae bacterium]|nr:tetratricopeptide repeat protein [Streptosporangiaceae bacterium]